jgi:GMP synthase-like glutamine amidotransferase
VRNSEPNSSHRALVLQHHPDEHPGALGPLLEAHGLALTTVEVDAGEDIPGFEPFSLLLVMGGPQQVWEDEQHPWLVREKEVIRSWVGELRRPYLGICLGHQLLADAMGGRVGRMDAPEIGVLEIEQTPTGTGDPVFGALPTRFPSLQWHEAEVIEPPPGALVLAQNSSSPIQALRVGRCALGVQFHVEVGPDTVSKWSAVPDYERTLSAHFGSDHALELAVADHLGRMRSVAASLVDAFLDDVLAARAAL